MGEDEKAEGEGEAAADDAAYVEERKKKKEEKEKGGKKKKGLFGFGGGDKKPKKSEEEIKEEKDREKRVAERKKRGAEEADRIEKADAAKRMKEKNERQQALLKKNLDPSPRVFQLNMKAMKIENKSGKQQRGLFLKVTLGGDYEEREEPGKGLVKKGKKGQIFTTAPSARVENKKTHYVVGEFGAGVPIYWLGSYSDLEVQDLLIEVYGRGPGRFAPGSVKKAEYRTPLSQVAQQSIQQELELFEGLGDDKEDFAILSVVLYFQELYVFQLKFTNWKGFNLKASDAPKRKARVKQTMTADEKKENKRLEKAEKIEAKKQKQKELLDAKRAKRRGGGKPAVDAGAAMGGEDGEGAGIGDGDGEAAGEGGDDTTKLLENDGASPRPEAPKKKGKLSFEDRKAAGKKNEMAKKAIKDSKHSAKLEMVRKHEEKQKERVRKIAEDVEKKKNAKFDPELFEEASADPYIVFSIDPPSNPGCKIFRRGGYFGRKTKTDVQLCTLNPFWEEAFNPLSYLGTRSELENEILRVRVYDWDLFSSDDLIGKADVPLNGLLEYGQAEVELTFEEEDFLAPKVRGVRPKKIVPAGRLQGQIVFDGASPTPEYKQLGTIVEKLAGVTYLAVRVLKAKELKPADISGFSDPFVTVEWDGCEQVTKVITRNLNPTWNETLYFPLKCALNKAVLENKSNVSVRVYDFDVAGPDLLGSFDVPLHKITAAELAQLDDETQVDGKKHKGRVLKMEGTKLVLPEQQIESTLDVWLYFTPDLPLEITLEEVAKAGGGRGLDPDYEQRLRSWWDALPPEVQLGIADAQQLELASDKQMFAPTPGQADVKAIVSAEDQDCNVHMLCEYLSPVLPPSELNDPGKIARMVRMMQWEDDDEVFGGTRSNVWQAPNFFMELKRGDFEDHAIYLANLLLGMNIDAYVCCGRLHTAKKGEKRHVWVMVREDDGCVRFWETSTGDDLEMKGRWRGEEKFMAKKREEEEKAEKAAEKEKEAANRGGGGGGGADADKKGGKGKKGGKKSRRRSTKKKGKEKEAAAAAAAATEAEAEAEAEAAEGEGEDDDDDERERGREQKLALWRRRKSGQGHDDVVDIEMELRELLNEDETLGTSQIEEPKLEIFYVEPGAEESAASTAGPSTDTAPRPADSGGGGSKELVGMPSSLLLEPLEAAPAYAQIEVIFNHQNLYASKQYYDPVLKKGPVNQLDPALLTYDFEDDSAWEAFLRPEMRADGKPVCFYAPRRVAAAIAKDRLRTMEQQIQGEIKSQLTMARAALGTSVNTMKELVQQLCTALELQETAYVNPANETGTQALRDYEKWARQIKDKTPPKSRFKGRMINYAYTDAKRIRKHLLSVCNYHASKEDGLEFLVAVKCFGYQGGVVSVWVYYGLLDKPEDEE